MEIENLKLQKQIDELIDKIYPIGSYYETSNSYFDPNDEWGGVWARDTNGYVTVGCQDPDESGITYEDNDRLLINNRGTKGEVNHTLSVEELPAHSHLIDRIFEGLPGSDNWAYRASSEYIGGKMNTGETGSNQPHNNIQPSIGVYRWHRIA